MRRLVFILLVVFSTASCFSQVELAVQKGHSDDIVLLEFSHSGRYLASLAQNNEVIIWEIQHEKSISSFTVRSDARIQGMKFATDERKLKVRLDSSTVEYNLLNSTQTEQDLPGDTLYRKKDYFYHAESNYEVEIYHGAIRKKKKDKKIRKYKLSVNYLNAPFTAFDVSPTSDLIVGVAEDQKTYVYNFSRGLKKKVLGGHFSAINDIRFSKDGKWFATAGRDRSIILWNASTLEMETRFSSNVYRKKTACFSQDGERIYVGDELGYIYEIDFRYSFPAIRVVQPNLYSVNKIMQASPKENSGYYVASSNNFIYYKTNLASSDPDEKYEFRENAFLKAKKRVLQTVFRLYQDPFGEPSVLDISPDGKKLLYTGKSDIPNVTLAYTEKKKVKHFYNYGDWKQWTDVGFMTDSTFIAISDSSNVLYQWKIVENNYYMKTDTLPFLIRNVEYLSQGVLWVSSYDYGQFMYNTNTRSLAKKNDLKCENLFHLGKFMVQATEDHDLVFYDLISNEHYYTFKGHADVVTDVNIHPEGRLFVSSSDDGTVKLWSLGDNKLVSTMIPFKNREFVFVTDDNYYMITKGAMDEIGFKYEGQFFNPDQFDLKYNRPDKVLGQLGYSDSSLIKAYHKAYLKRLKKLNFKEEQLTDDFHLPLIEIGNELDLELETAAESVDLELIMTDGKYELDRLNIWVNDVAIHGTDGVNLRDKKVKIHELSVKVPLANGKNKIEVGVLNSTGAESYKKEVTINSSAGKEKPDLFIVSLGVSKHKDSKYNLEFADKDAVDISETFKSSPYFGKVNAKTYTNEEVTLENLLEIKPFLETADINDVVILFVAGHGVLDENFDYYFASYDMDFSDPSKRGIPYGEIERLLDGIKALKKLLFIDTCHSGELDKDEIEETHTVQGEDGELIFRRVGRTVKVKDNPLGLQSTNELMKSLFTDLRRGTGATVISSSGGAELSIEGGEYENGLFTYCLIQGLVNKDADKNKDREVTIAELQLYVQKEVKKISKGKQTPTSRIQNNELDYRLW